MNRHQRRAACAAMAGAGLLAVTAGSAEALPFSLGTTGVPASQVLSFGKFNPADGTLTGVVFTLSGSSTSATSGVQLTGPEGGTGAASMSASFQIESPGDGGPLDVVLFDATGGASSSCFAPNTASIDVCDDTSTSTTVSPPFPGQFTVTDPLDLASYLGAGFFDVTVGLSIISSLVTQCTGPQEPVCTPSADASWLGNLTVAFEFDRIPPPGGGDVPEPGALLFLALGLPALVRLWRGA